MKGPGGSGGLDMGDVLKQAQKMQKDLARIQEELKERVVEGASGGGMVKAFANGAQDLVGIKIEPDVIDPDDAEMLEDMVVAAVNQAMAKAKELQTKEMGKATGGLGLPGLF